jgi:thiosulfate sulfurtransferase
MCNSIEVTDLLEKIGSKTPPIIFDVRKTPAFLDSGRMIEVASKQDHLKIGEQIANLQPACEVIVYCVHGHELSQNAANLLQKGGVNAFYLAGGFDAWQKNDGPTIVAPKPE